LEYTKIFIATSLDAGGLPEIKKRRLKETLESINVEDETEDK